MLCRCFSRSATRRSSSRLAVSEACKAHSPLGGGRENAASERPLANDPQGLTPLRAKTGGNPYFASPPSVTRLQAYGGRVNPHRACRRSFLLPLGPSSLPPLTQVHRCCLRPLLLWLRPSSHASAACASPLPRPTLRGGGGRGHQSGGGRGVGRQRLTCTDLPPATSPLLTPFIHLRIPGLPLAWPCHPPLHL